MDRDVVGGGGQERNGNSSSGEGSRLEKADLDRKERGENNSFALATRRARQQINPIATKLVICPKRNQ